MSTIRYLLVTMAAACFLVLASCGGEGHRLVDEDIASAAATITAEDLLSHTEVLASDEFEGRAPATPGEKRTVEYLSDQFARLGLEPGNPDGTYSQTVPLIEITPTLEASFQVSGQELDLKAPDDFVAHSLRAEPEVIVDDSELVFVGYGVVAPEYGWDDYKEFDVGGKTILMLVNDPAVAASDDPSKLDDSIFKGNAMTYYGRWTYKYEVATEKKAAAALVIHETGPAGYPYEVVSGDFGLSQFDIQQEDGNTGRVAIQGWIHRDAVSQLFKQAGLNFDEMKQAALSRDFRPISLNGKASFKVTNRLNEVNSHNVIARLEGSDPALKNEHLLYIAHWDHLGVDLKLEGDQIFNGAHDNATGTAGLLELAEAFKKLRVQPERSLLFLAVTAEEQGLLGAKYYAENPLYPLKEALAVINMDGLNQWGSTSDVVIIGYGNSTLDDVVTEEANRIGRSVKPDAEPEKGFFYRSDHFEFAKQGVPALYPDEGVDFIGKPAGYGKQKRKDYTANDYHKVSDEIKPDWDLTGAVEDLHLLFKVGLRIIEEAEYPEWKTGTEFKTIRDAMMKE